MTELGDKYPEVERFANLMLNELWANRHKGDQAGWLAAEPEALLNDITWHWAKLAHALRDLQSMHAFKSRLAVETDQEKVREYAVDVANMSMMLLDRLGLL